MRIPYYLAQYDQSQAPAPKSTVLPVLVVAAVVLFYAGTLAVLLLGGRS